MERTPNMAAVCKMYVRSCKQQKPKYEWTYLTSDGQV